MRTDILNHAKSNTTGRGIFPASRYLSDVAGCLSGGACPTQVMSLTSEDVWEKALEKSVETLTATDTDWTFDEKSFGSEKGYILTATGIMSTSKMDSDRDILDAKGAELEAVCPYLWHHIMMQPVGKVLSHTLSTVKSGEKDLDAVLFKCGILDVGNGLGRDTALLIELGAIRNSHGFEPLEAKPIKGAGWHVTKYRTFEISAVTVPANSDAVFTEYSKQKSKFQSDVVKNWIKGHYDTRQKSWKGFDLAESKKGHVEIECTLNLDTSEAEEKIKSLSEMYQEALAQGVLITDEHKAAETCGCQKNKEVLPVRDEKFYLPGLPGSWESIQSELRKSAHEYIRHEMREPCCCYGGWIESTFKDYVILAVYTDNDEEYYKVAWGMVDGKAALTGEFTKVEITFMAAITETDKSAEVPETKTHKETTSVHEVIVPEGTRVMDPVLASLGL